MQPCIFFRGQILAGKYYDWQISERGNLAEALQYVEARHIGEAQVENDTVKRFLCDSFQGLLSGGGDLNIYILVSEQFLNTKLFARIVLYNKQALATRRSIFFDAGEGGIQFVGSRWFVHIGERAAGQAMLAILIHRQHLNRNVPHRGVLFEVVENGPSQHIRQENIERYSGWVEFAG